MTDADAGCRVVHRARRPRAPLRRAGRARRRERARGERADAGGAGRQRGGQDHAAACAGRPAAPARRARARVLGAELPGERWQAAGRVGYLGHEPLLYRELTARENLDYHARLHASRPGARGRAARRRGHGAARRRARCATSRAAWCSGVAAARAVLHEPELLLLDEPRANLDPAAAELLEPLIGRAVGAHACAGDPRRGGRPGRGRRGAGPARRAPGAAGGRPARSGALP